MSGRRTVSVFKLNYERAIVYDFPRSGVTPLYAGSSTNRNHNEKKKIERRKKEAQALGVDVYADRENRLLFSNEVGELCSAAKESLRGNNKRKQSGRPLYSISKSSGRKIRNKCAAFFESSARAFATLTFIQDVSDKKALDCLKNFLHQWRKDFGKNFNYLWVAERQHNGRIHFHLMIDRPVDIKKENTRWIRIQYNAGLQYTDKQRNFTYQRTHIEAWASKGRLQEKLNPFDVEYIKNQSHLSYYLTKYITKTANNEEGATFEFLPWKCSRNISAMHTETIILPDVFFEATTETNTVVVQKQFVRKKTGELVEPGTVIAPQVHKNDWAISVNILNRPHFHSWLWDLRQLNKKIAAGERPKIIEYDADHYYNDYCRSFTLEDLEMLALTPKGTNTLEIAGEKVLMADMPYSDNDYYGYDAIEKYKPKFANRLDLAGNKLN